MLWRGQKRIRPLVVGCTPAPGKTTVQSDIQIATQCAALWATEYLKMPKGIAASPPPCLGRGPRSVVKPSKSPFMQTIQKASVERIMLIGFGMTVAVLLLVGGIALNTAAESSLTVKLVEGGIVFLLACLTLMYIPI